MFTQSILGRRVTSWTPATSVSIVVVLVVGFGAPAACADPIVVSRGVLSPPWSYPPSPSVYPTDYWGLPASPQNPLGWIADHSPTLPHPDGQSEPGPHVWGAPGYIFMANRQGEEYSVKKVWLQLQFTQGQPQVNYQTEGEFDQSQWPSITAPNSTPTLTGASWDVPVGTNIVNLFVTWELRPQPESERIDIRVTQSQMTDAGSRLEHINVLTSCIPEPATIGMIAFGLLTAVLRVLAR